MKIHPLTGEAPGKPLPVRSGGATGRVGSFGLTRKDDAGKPKMHRGVDWRAEMGDVVHAAHAGEVRVARVVSGYGLCCYLVSPNLLTIYAHLSRSVVSAGEVLQAGAPVGHVGRSGISDASIPTHLHFEVRLVGAVMPAGHPQWDASAVNPEWWLHGAPFERDGQTNGKTRKPDWRTA